jgi:hypothetical protein
LKCRIEAGKLGNRTPLELRDGKKENLTFVETGLKFISYSSFFLFFCIIVFYYKLYRYGNYGKGSLINGVERGSTGKLTSLWSFINSNRKINPIPTAHASSSFTFPLHDVVLPPWANGDPDLFISLQREFFSYLLFICSHF